MMIRLPLLTLAILCFLPALQLSAQQARKCNAPHILDDLSPTVQAATIRARAQVNALGDSPASTLRQRCHSSYRIPVVFHVIHNRTVDSISAAQIQTQMAVLNEDYRKKSGTPGFGSGVDANIEFYLAQRDPSGQFTTGITYTKDSIAHFTYSAANDTLLKSKIKWPQQLFLNIWVVDTIMFGPSYLLGYAHFPSNGVNPLDGVVIADQHVGRNTGTAKVPPYNRGRTLTHEVGHYLGLYHPFDYVNNPCEGNTATTCANQGDFVCDVPPHANPHFGCPTFPQNTCFETPKDTNDFIYNFMEYVDDSCMNMFSQGQATRMQNVLDTDSFRIIMVSTDNLIQRDLVYHGLPDPDFVPMGSHCVWDSMFLFNRTLGVGPGFAPLPDTQWMWSLPGGFPDTSNAQHPYVVYRSPGTYNIMLTVVNNFGQCIYPFALTIGGPNVMAAGDNVNIGDSTSFFTFSDEPGSWAWNFGDGTGDSVGFGPNPRYAYPTVDSFIFTAAFTPEDSTQCVVRVRDTVWVSEAPLAAMTLDFQGAYTASDAVALSWRSSPDPGRAAFLLERSRDGSHFTKLADIGVKDARSGDGGYAFLDETAPWRQVWYRLRPVDREGQAGTGRVLSVLPPTGLHLVYGPNPVRDALHLDIRAAAKSALRLRLTDMYGRTMYASDLEMAPGVRRVTLSLGDFSAGIYLLQAWDGLSGKMLCQGKLLRH